MKQVNCDGLATLKQIRKAGTNENRRRGSHRRTMNDMQSRKNGNYYLLLMFNNKFIKQLFQKYRSILKVRRIYRKNTKMDFEQENLQKNYMKEIFNYIQYT